MRLVELQRLKHGSCECKTITIPCCVINWGETDAGKNNIFKTLGKTITCVFVVKLHKNTIRNK